MYGTHVRKFFSDVFVPKVVSHLLLSILGNLLKKSVVAGRLLAPFDPTPRSAHRGSCRSFFRRVPLGGAFTIREDADLGQAICFCFIFLPLETLKKVIVSVLMQAFLTSKENNCLVLRRQVYLKRI